MAGRGVVSQTTFIARGWRVGHRRGVRPNGNRRMVVEDPVTCRMAFGSFGADVRRSKEMISTFPYYSIIHQMKVSF